MAVRAKPFLFGLPVVNVFTMFLRRDVCDRHENMLRLRQRQRFQWPQETVFEYSFQLSRHGFILASGAAGAARAAESAWRTSLLE